MEYKKYSVKQHETCRQTILNKKIDITPFLPYLLTITSIIAIYLVALLSYYIRPCNFNFFSFLVGLFSWSWFYTNSQKILNLNAFVLYAIIGFLIVFLHLILMLITNNSLYNCLTVSFSFFYIIYFRLLTYLFFKDFARSYLKPTIFFAEKWRKWSHENIDRNYIPTKKELIFSNLLFLGPWGIGLCVFYAVIKL
ncbi:hypothetical protein [Flavobacterium chilense]|uniref:Uncharacterized protein n=1 Tax=Flavobacterium chilense TaxID=946677 RepID=A0A1M6Z6E4_9FLAO|nr:hypothetical protein [Flavobacterium chilense]SHL26034.1 hypothetical protein SAMN05444484_101894 [Flavobacterium chilense]